MVTIKIRVAMPVAAFLLALAALLPASVAAAGSPKPDGLIQYALNCYPNPTECKAPNPPKPWVGNNVYNSTGQNQAVTLKYYSTSPLGSWAVLNVKVQNDGTASGRFKLHSQAASGVKYFHGSTNITSAVVAGTYQTASLTPGSSYQITVKVPESANLVGTTRLVTITSATDSTKKDAVKFSVKAGGSCGC